MTQFELTQMVIVNRKALGLDTKDYLTLIYITSQLNFTKYPTGTLKLTKGQICEGIGKGTTAVSESLSVLFSRGLIERVCTRNFLMRVNFTAIEDSCTLSPLFDETIPF